jgi:UDPglucose 6-dehydrogenase
VGTGYVGLSCGACLSTLGHNVVCVDIDQDKIDSLKAGVIPIFEVDLESIVRRGLDDKRISFTTEVGRALESAEFVFLCLPTPQADDGSADLSYLMSAVREISALVRPGSIVITKSTVPIGTFAEIEEVLNRSDVFLASNPEFVREGSAVFDFLNPDRIVIGSNTLEVSKRVASIYQGLTAPLVMTDPASAETIKHASNSFLALKLSYINAISIICELYGADVLDVSEGIGLDNRIGSGFLQPGPGWGGSCFPKDTSALLRMAESKGYNFGLLSEAVAVNMDVQDRIVENIRLMLGGSLSEKRITAWGLTFKAKTDDIRDSPAIKIVQMLLSAGADVTCYDPTVRDIPSRINRAHLALTPEASCETAELLVVLTEWDEFKSVNPIDIYGRMSAASVFDCRNILPERSWIAAGFVFQGIGRKKLTF